MLYVQCFLSLSLVFINLAFHELLPLLWLTFRESNHICADPCITRPGERPLNHWLSCDICHSGKVRRTLNINAFIYLFNKRIELCTNTWYNHNLIISIWMTHIQHKRWASESISIASNPWLSLSLNHTLFISFIRRSREREWSNNVCVCVFTSIVEQHSFVVSIRHSEVYQESLSVYRLFTRRYETQIPFQSKMPCIWHTDIIFLVSIRNHLKWKNTCVKVKKINNAHINI